LFVDDLAGPTFSYRRAHSTDDTFNSRLFRAQDAFSRLQLTQQPEDYVAGEETRDNTDNHAKDAPQSGAVAQKIGDTTKPCDEGEDSRNVDWLDEIPTTVSGLMRMRVANVAEVIETCVSDAERYGQSSQDEAEKKRAQ